MDTPIVTDLSSRLSEAQHELTRRSRGRSALPRVTMGLRHLHALLTTDRQSSSSGRDSVLSGRWEVQDRVGKGAFSEVFSVRDTCGQGKTYAMKVYPMRYHLLGVREEIILRYLSRYDWGESSSFLSCYGGIVHSDHFYLRLELMAANLYQFISQPPNSSRIIRPIVKRKEDMRANDSFHYRSEFDTRKIQIIALSLLTGLSYMHSEGLIHADIKPENIYLQFDENFILDPKQLRRLNEIPDSFKIKIGDFSNSFHTSEVKFEQSVDYEVQSLPYRAPEVLFGCPFGVQIDVWSVGIILLELCLHRLLFQAEDRGHMIELIGRLLGFPPLKRFAGGRFYNGLLSFYPELRREYSFRESCQRIHKLLVDLYVEVPRHLVSFLASLLMPNPDDRMSALSALQHSFLVPVVGLSLRSVLMAAGGRAPSQDRVVAASISALRYAHRTASVEAEAKSPEVKVVMYSMSIPTGLIFNQKEPPPVKSSRSDAGLLRRMVDSFGEAEDQEESGDPRKRPRA